MRDYVYSFLLLMCNILFHKIMQMAANSLAILKSLE